MKKKYLILLFIFLSGCMKEKEPTKGKTIDITDKEETRENYYTVTYKATTGGYILGESTQVVLENTKTSVVKAMAYDGYHFLYWSDGVKNNVRTFNNVNEDINLEAIFLEDSLKYPDLFIETNGVQIKSKVDYVTCTVKVTDYDYPYNDFEGELGQIRGRGNSTWDKPKKPYKLKFDKKVDLFGFGKAKDWVLLANYVDPGMIRNYLAYSICARFDDSPYTTHCQYVNLYIDGYYNGLYLVCEQTEVNKERVNINTSIGGDLSFFIELDERAKDDGLVKDFDYFVFNNKSYVIKSPNPDSESYTKEYTLKIKEYINNCFSLLRGDDYSLIEANLDVGTFADGYIMSELFSCIDVYFASWYLYKDKGGKLCNGPIWDYDISAGNCDYNDQSKDSNKLYAITNLWYRYLLTFDEFRDLVKEKLVKYYEIILNTIVTKIDLVMFHQEEFERNYRKWKTLGKYVWPNPEELVAMDNFKDHVAFVEEWLFSKLDYMMKTYNR